MRAAAVAAFLTLAFGLFCGAGAQDDILQAGPGLAGQLRGGPGQRLEMLRSMVDRDDEREPELMLSWLGPAFLLRHREALDLSQEQVEKLKAIRLDMVRQTGALRADLRVGEFELQDLLDNCAKVDLPKVEAKVKALGEFRSSLNFTRIKAQVEATRVLSDEQREKALKLRQNSHRGPFPLPGPGFGRLGGPGVHKGFIPGPECELETPAAKGKQ